MFDFAWSEIALVGIVALLVIGPKDLPEAIRGIARGIAKLRRMASEFQGQADELVREANLDEVRNSINEIRNFNVRDQLTKAVDADGSIRKAFSEDPLKADYSPPYTPPAVTEPEASTAAVEGASVPPGSAEPPRAPAAPAFIPPAFVPPAPVSGTPASEARPSDALAPEAPLELAAAPPAPTPAFVPPSEEPAPVPISTVPVPAGPPNPTQQS
jgi:sec-independent protein translocase protein TatB